MANSLSYDEQNVTFILEADCIILTSVTSSSILIFMLHVCACECK